MQASVGNIFRIILILVFLLGISGCCIIVEGFDSQAHHPTLKADHMPVQAAAFETP